MKQDNLAVVRELVYKLVRIANKEEISISPEEAKLAVRVIDLTEPYIIYVPDEYFEGYIHQEKKQKNWLDSNLVKSIDSFIRRK